MKIRAILNTKEKQEKKFKRIQLMFVKYPEKSMKRLNKFLKNPKSHSSKEVNSFLRTLRDFSKKEIYRYYPYFESETKKIYKLEKDGHDVNNTHQAKLLELRAITNIIHLMGDVYLLINNHLSGCENE